MLRERKFLEDEVRQLLAQNRRLEAEELLKSTSNGSRKEVKNYLDRLMGRPKAFR